MPTYKVMDPSSGKTFRLTGDSPPTEAELTDIFGGQTIETNAAPEAETGAPSFASTMSGPEKFLVGAGKGMMDVGYGAAQLGLQGAELLG
ncbi:MAG: hypothetical protein WC291_12155, partial [Thermodesulfovibrionales bacterium]